MIESIALYYLLEYEGLVAYCNSIITEYYQLDRPAMLAKSAGIIPRSATIKLNHTTLYYCFHGIGCYCKIGKSIIDFDYCFGTFEYKGFEADKVWMFIESQKQIQLIDKCSFLDALIDL